MSQIQPTDPSTIRISAADASSAHVDDLLKRQASLRGDTGISRDTGRKWYLQNWFVLALAGLLAAAIGWALLKPLMQDLPYIQGTIDAIEPPSATDFAGVEARIKIQDTSYPILSSTKVRSGSQKWAKLDMASLAAGQPIGIYVSFPRNEEDAKILDFWAAYIQLAPQGAADSNIDFKDSVKRVQLGNILFFPVVAGLIGLFIGAADGLMCRLWRRGLIAGAIGLIVGLIGGFFSDRIAELVYAPISAWVEHQHGAGIGGMSTMGFLAQVGGRGFAWALAGMAMGLGQGLALRSPRVILYGFLGGVLGGLFGGLLFDPIYFLISGEDSPSAALSRLVSLCVIGLSVGGLIGLVELLARDAWLRMVAGPLAGKEFLIFKNTMQVGASPRSDIYLFNDEAVAQKHAVIRSTGDLYEIERASDMHPLTVNGRAVQRTRLRHGDQIGLGRTIFVFQSKRG